MNKPGFLEKYKDEIIKQYLAGVGTVKLGQQYNTSHGSILALLKRHNISRRSFLEAGKLHRKYIAKIPDKNNLTDEDYYWLGFMATDGCIMKNKIHLNIQAGDINHLKKFCDWLKIGHDMIHNSTKKTKNKIFYGKRIGLSDKELADFFKSFDIIERKSLIYRVHPKLKNNIHFWRAAIDGDGCITHSRKIPVISLCGTKDIIEKFRFFIKKSLGIKYNKIYIDPRKNNLNSIRYAGTKAITIMDLLYKDATVYLDRKYQRYLNFKKQRRIQNENIVV